ncbi:MAG: glycosyltransferase family 39 protein, partial [Thermodesulfobacteriota bacterium]
MTQRLATTGGRPGRDAPASTAAAARTTRLGVGLGVVLAALLLASLPWTVRDFWDARPDAARYLLAARSLAAGDGYTVMGEPFRLRPPGFSALLAPLVAWRGFDFALLNAFVSVVGVVAVVLLYALLLPRVGAVVAFATALVVWLNPQLQALVNQVLSDVPGLALALAALLVLRRANARRSWQSEVALGIALAAAAYVRSANLLLVPALLLDRTLGRPSRRAPEEMLARFAALRLVLPLAVLGVLYLPWIAQPSYSSQYDSPDLHSYATAFLRTDPNDPGAAPLGAAQWLARLGRNAVAYAGIFASGM